MMMSLFQCDKCGVCENTACTNAGRSHMNNHTYTDPRSGAALASYREILGLTIDEEFGAYCSVCTPFWFSNGYLGVGPNPNPKPGEGLWHGRFEQRFYPLGTMETDSVGNLAPRRLR